MKGSKLKLMMSSIRNHKWWPHTWTTFKFGCLFSGSELTQQIIIRKIWDDDRREWRSAQNRLPIDWANVGNTVVEFHSVSDEIQQIFASK